LIQVGQDIDNKNLLKLHIYVGKFTHVIRKLRITTPPRNKQNETDLTWL